MTPAGNHDTHKNSLKVIPMRRTSHGLDQIQENAQHLIVFQVAQFQDVLFQVSIKATQIHYR